MKKTNTILFFLSVLFLSSSVFSQVIFSDDFESGTADVGWGTYYAGENELQAVAMTEAPAALPSGGEYVGWLQDVDGSYSGSAVAISGSTSLSNYSIEADVYCYVTHSEGSAYTGLVVYADASKNDFYKLRADFDVSDRINFSGLKSDPNTFMPLFSKDFKGEENPGLFPTIDGWHKMKIEVRATSDTETSFWCYFDDTLLAGCPITDTTSTRVTSGQFGLYAFQMGGNSDGIPGYFDNIIVNPLEPIVSVEDRRVEDRLPQEFALQQNYPNPFNPTTNISYQIETASNVSLVIYDVLGSKVKTLVSENQAPGYHSVTWNGRSDFGVKVNSGVYLYTLKAGQLLESKKMILMK